MRPSLACVAVALTVAAGRYAGAQGGNATLRGVVTDASAARIAGAEVVVRNDETGFVRSLQTGASGAYLLTELRPGTYTIHVGARGFASLDERGITLDVGEERTLDASLNAASASTSVVVSSEPSRIATESAALSDVTGRQAIEQLPLNGRDTLQLALLTPGVLPSRRVNPDSQGNGRQISIEGRRPNQVSFLLDGSDVNDAYNNTPGSAAGTVLGADAVAEFRVLSNGYGAEYGRSAGGVISQITRAGDNRLRGSLFSFVRNSAADARNYFDDPALRIPRYQRNQFGGALGGPLRRDRLFYFGNYEGVRQRLGTTRIAIVPNATARSTASSGVRPYLNLIPLPNATIYSDGTGQYRSQAKNTADEDFFVVRGDWQPTSRTLLFARYRIDTSSVMQPDLLLVSANRNRSRDKYLTVQAVRTVRDNFANTLRLSANRSVFTLDFDYLRAIDPALSFAPGSPFGQISITGLAPIGPARFGPTLNVLNLFQGTDEITLSAGRHVITAGFDEKQILFPQQAPQSQNGFYLFNSLSTFLAGTPTSLEVALPGSNPRRHWRQHMDAAWVSDAVRLRDNFTLTAGLRYERVSVPREQDGLSSAVRDPLRDTGTTIGPLYLNPTNANLMPRVGLAYAPGRARRTSMRSAFGVYFDPLWTDFYLNAGSRNPPFFTVGTVNAPVFPTPNITRSNFVLGRLDVLPWRPASPYTLQWNASVQQQVSDAVLLTVAYSANRGVHDTRIVDVNQALPQIVNGRKFFPANSAVRNPNFTSIRLKQTNGLSSYNGLVATLDYRGTRYLQLRGTYAWSKSLDTGSLVTAQGTENGLPQDPDSRRAEKGLSNYDLRHYFAGYGIVMLPQLCGRAWLCGGWQWNTVATFSSGAPFSVLVSYDSARARFGTGPSPERPDLVPGRSPNPVLGGAQRYFDASSFALPAPGFYGNLPRNTLIGPGLAQIDVAINKDFRLGDRCRMQVRSELFNVPNHPNFAIPNQRNVFSPAGRVASAGLITQTLTSSRQLQLGARLSF